VEAFRSGLPDSSPEQGLVATIRSANTRIHEMSQSDSSRQGMGTTTTAAYVGEREVIIAHVGDSRCYLLRDGELTRLTRDHSLVGELVDRGKLTEEQAEMHPQRSVITRALGSEPDVEVDVHVYQAKAGDVFMLNSDGLTSMVPDDRVKGILGGASSLEQAGRDLITAANDAGGRDNITVILFRLEEVDGTGSDAPAAATAVSREDDTSEYETFEGDAVPAPRQGVSRPAGVSDDDVLRSSEVSDTIEDDYRRSGTVALSAIRPSGETEAPEEPPPQEPDAPAPPRRTAPLPGDTGSQPRRKRRRRVPVGLIVTLVIAFLILAGGWMATRAVYFVGTDPRDDRTIAVFQGLPYDLPLGVKLYTRTASSGVTIDSVPPDRRKTFTDHKLRSKDDAENLVTALERGQIE